ncbi:sigma factor-like helix-turn-helix DNA-binding protein [Pseudomonas sp. LP_7_YM]|uniref:sigma factor-like helix-turn-helix DNA-binding protein n=1 Tax=Pseudomonas sp. LP_7_YM TaxID=2485137 RepID=UPI00105B2992|nr:sigma factor-like helix-turn-helix DNA-binding protein [Pseudomonas sp. LP_7_YM]TDV70266.1 RNA polymerase sigma-70 factor (ECF subfamily) [Pseudomonas sp. LP_7_YM]
MSGVDPSHRQYLSELFQHHYRWLCERLRGHLDGAQSAEDIAAETFLQLLAAPNVVPIREPRALLTTIAQRLVYQCWRRSGLERDYLTGLIDEEHTYAPSAESLAATLQALDRIDRRLNRLPPKIKTTFMLSRSVGLTYPEIAHHLGISSRSVSDYMEKAETCCLRACLE